MAVPLHDRIRSELEASILSGALSPGERLPIEHELMASYRCSRMTVSKALSALAAAGLIERRKRAGSFVASPRVQSMILDIQDLAEEIGRRGQLYRYQLVRRGVSEDNQRDPVFTVGGGPALDVTGIHLADGAPFAVERRLVGLAAVPAIAEADLDREAPGSWLLRHVPWTEAETRIAAVGAEGGVAALLGVAAGTPLLRVERRTWRGGEGVTAVRQHFLGSAYDLVARFGPRAGAGKL